MSEYVSQIDKNDFYLSWQVDTQIGQWELDIRNGRREIVEIAQNWIKEQLEKYKTTNKTLEKIKKLIEAIDIPQSIDDVIDTVKSIIDLLKELYALIMIVMADMVMAATLLATAPARIVAAAV